MERGTNSDTPNQGGPRPGVRESDEVRGKRTPVEFGGKAERLLAMGSPIAAYDLLADALVQFPGDTRLRQLLAHALARTGASSAAIPLLEALLAEGQADEETLGLLASAHKDLWAAATTAPQRQEHLALAYRYYSEAHHVSGGIWSGINAATTALLLGKRGEMTQLARTVRDRCLREQQSDPARAAEYWQIATLAEAELLLGAWPAAERLYARAAEIGRSRVADRASTRRNARLIVQALDVDGRAIEQILRIPRVIAFVGHMIDRPDRAVPRFPAALEHDARRAIRDRLQRLDAGFGYSSAACGADILFLEALSEMNGETTIVLPYDADQFQKDSVDFVPGTKWAERYRRALAGASDVVMASERRIAAGEMSHEYASLLIDGLAGVRADELDAELAPLAVWDGRPSEDRGGTGVIVSRWRRAGRPVEIIDLADLARASGLPIAPASPAVLVPEPGNDAQLGETTAFEPQIVALLFADAKGFSGLREDQMPSFVQGFLGIVARTLQRRPNQPLLKNTWGDGLYFVFATAAEAAGCALDLADAIAGTDWAAWGLPKELALRIGLHAGPAYVCTDPVTGRRNYLGAHVSRAARIEPITPPGHVYASRAFAAVARAEQVTEFRYDYVGKTLLPKSAGTLPMYVVRRRQPADAASRS